MSTASDYKKIIDKNIFLGEKIDDENCLDDLISRGFDFISSFQDPVSPFC
jgi:hypothetical protein